MKKTLLLAIGLMISNYAHWECSLSTLPPKVTPGNSSVNIEWRVKWACWEKLNEFWVFYLENGNWIKISDLAAWDNQAEYSVDWNITNKKDWEYQVRVIQHWENTNYITSKPFGIDRVPPIIRDDLWIMPTWWEILKGKVMIKWNPDSVFDTYKLSDTPIFLEYSLDWKDYKYISSSWWIANSWIFIWDTSWIDWNNVYVRLIAKDTFSNSNSNIMPDRFIVDNTAPTTPSISQINWKDIEKENNITITPIISVWEIALDAVRIAIVDTTNDKVYWAVSTKSWSLNLSWSQASITLDVLPDGKFSFWAIAYDEAWNTSEISNAVTVIRDSYPPKAPIISFAAIVNNNLRVGVTDLEKKDIDSWELTLMNWDIKVVSQSSKDSLFNLSMIPQWIYNLYVIHKDSAWNISDKSNIKKIIYDTAPPEDVKISIPTWIALYDDIDFEVSASDNVWVDIFELSIDWNKFSTSKDWKFQIKTNSFKNGMHLLQSTAKDYAWNKSSSSKIEIKIFNSLIPWHWSNNYIRSMYETWLLKGEWNTWTIDPEGKLNRASALKLITESFIWWSESYWWDFADVKQSDWFAPYVWLAYKKGIVKGYINKHQLTKIWRSWSYSDNLNLQFALKWLWYNIVANWIYDSSTIRAVANYQKAIWLTPSWDLWLNTMARLNSEEIVMNWNIITDDRSYFKPWNLVQRDEALKMILEAADLDIPPKIWQWYEKYTSFALNNWIMTWNQDWDLQLTKTVTIWEMSKMILKTKDLMK